MKRYALFSVDQTEGLLHFAECLTSIGWTIIATSVPYTILKDAGIDVISVDDFVDIKNEYGFPLTLHPKIEYALTVNGAEERIELVYDITYGLEAGNDVGGHTLLALAAKGNRFPVSSYGEMVDLVSILSGGEENLEAERQKLIDRAHFKIAKHYARMLSISNQQQYETVLLSKENDLLNGENPYQVASLMKQESSDPLALHRFQLITENRPCFTNMADMDCIVEGLSKIHLAFQRIRGKTPYLTIAAKHGNPCGVGMDWNDPSKSIYKALWGDPLAIWGGEVITNFVISAESASLLRSSSSRGELYGNDKWMLDLIVAPEIDTGACDILKRRKNTKIFTNPQLVNPGLPQESQVHRFVRGGTLCQSPLSYILSLRDVTWVGTPLSEDQMDSLIIAWGCAYVSNQGGNEVAIAKDGCLLGIGGGPSTVNAAEIAVQRSLKSNQAMHDAIFAADAFFPFTDAPEILVNAGCNAGIVPAGGIRQNEVVRYFKEERVSVALLKEEYRGFCRH